MMEKDASLLPKVASNLTPKLIAAWNVLKATT